MDSRLQAYMDKGFIEPEPQMPQQVQVPQYHLAPQDRRPNLGELMYQEYGKPLVDKYVSPMAEKMKGMYQAAVPPPNQVKVNEGIQSLLETPAAKGIVNELAALDPIGLLDMGGIGMVSGKVDDAAMMLQHNLTGQNLLHAEKMGGIPVPSLAIVKANAPLEGFGEISLIGSAEMADPKKTSKMKVFGADVYSPRYPRDAVSYPISTKVSDKLEDILSDDVAVTADKIWPQQDLSPRDFSSNLAVQRSALRNSGVSGEALEPILEESGRVDRHKTRRKYDKALGEAGVTHWDMEDYATKLYDNAGVVDVLYAGYTPSGNRKYKAHTLENVVNMMKKDLRGGESFFYGGGSVRAQVAPQFKSLKQIRDNKDLLIDHEAMAALKVESDDALFSVSSALDKYSTYERSESAEAIAEIGSGRNTDAVLKEFGYEGVPDEVKTEIHGLLNKMSNMPTEYFEANILRAVDAGEFHTAIVPKDTTPEVLELLESKGLNIEKYAGDKRDSAFKRVGEKFGGEVLFQAGGLALIGSGMAGQQEQ